MVATAGECLYFTSSNSQSLDDTIINKDLEKSDSLELSEDKNALEKEELRRKQSLINAY